PQSHVTRRTHSVVSLDKDILGKRLLIIGGVLIVVIILLLFVVKGACFNEKQDNISPPAINLSK
ncbi:MAG: hypothetical protein N3B13_08240, partial [Deltaproteobacteria bacterium]|nr:hypothetical protein [Deltaproteobacteria bacterium]